MATGLADLHSASRRTRARMKGAVCAIVRAETHPGADVEFEALLREFARRVREAEPGCAAYVITRQMGSREHFAVHARFDDWAAFNGHAETPHLSSAAAQMSALLARPVSMEIFLEV